MAFYLTEPEEPVIFDNSQDCFDNKITCHVCGHRRMNILKDCVCLGKTEEEWELIEHLHQLEENAKIVKEKLKEKGYISPTDKEWELIPGTSEFFYEQYNPFTHKEPKHGFIQIRNGDVVHIDDNDLQRYRYKNIWRYLSKEQEDAWGIFHKD